MDVVETEWWTMALAPEGWADVEEDGTVLVADEDDVGCLEMTTLHKTDGQLTPAELKQIAVTESPSVPAWKASSTLTWLNVSCLTPLPAARPPLCEAGPARHPQLS